MKTRKASTIDELYKKVKNYDLVITVEAPLADALNNRINKPHLGEFATTPKRLAYGETRNEDLRDERELFLEVTKKTDLTWKESFYLLDNILSCWRETGELRKILEFDRFDDRRTRKVIEVIEETPNVYGTLEDYRPAETLSTAVIGPYQFNALDEKVVPEEYDTIEVFEGGERDLPEFSIFSTVTGLLGAIRENVSRENADDVAVVVSPESEYPSLLESVFRAENIPFMIRTDLSEDEDLRTLLSLMKYGVSSERLRVRGVQPILRRMGVNVSVKHNDEYLNDLEIEELNDFRKLLKSVNGSTFGEVLRKYENLMGDLSEIREKFVEIGILDEKLTEESVNRLEYYLDSFDVKIGGSERGVLIASSKSASYIDRPIVFYLGMDSTWTHSRPEKPWIDVEKYEERNLKNFELLLQNGEQQHFLVRSSKMGNDIAPCLYFDELTEKTFESFHDLPNRKYWGTKKSEARGFNKEKMDVEVESVEIISQSSLKNLVKSPRLYFFSRVVPTEYKDYFKIGNLLHHFAEFYVNHPDIVKECGVEEFVEIMLEEIKPLVDDLKLGQLETKFRIGIENVMEFLEREDIEDIEPSEYKERESENVFAEMFDKDLDLSVTELDFRDRDLGIKGRIDLVLDEDHIVDYKTGGRKSPRRLVRNSNVELFEDDPNFQPILYLTHLRSTNPESKLKMTFYHILENERDKVSGTADLEDNLSSITYYPRTFSEQLPRRETFENLKSSKAREKFLKKLGFEKYSEFFESHELPCEYEKDELLESDLTEEFTSYSKGIIGDFKYVEKGCRNILKNLVYFRKGNYFKEDLDKFEEFLKEQIENLNEYKRSRFPIGDADLDDLDNRDLLLGDEFGT